MSALRTSCSEFVDDSATVAPMLKVTVVVPVEVGIGLLEISSLI